MKDKLNKLHSFLKEEIYRLLLEDDDDTDIPGDEEDVPANDEPTPNPEEPEGAKVFYATVDQMADIIRKTKGRVFKVEFIKRMTGTDRVLLGRIGVKAYLHGGVLPYDPNEKNLIPCFDVQKRDYRMISIEGIQSLKFQGNIYVLKGTTLTESILVQEARKNK